MIKKEEQKINIEIESVPEELKELVIARLNMIPDNITVSVGSDGKYTRSELIERVESGDVVGQEIIKTQVDFLKALASGRLIDELTADS